jgi:hypothetical protein
VSFECHFDDKFVIKCRLRIVRMGKQQIDATDKNSRKRAMPTNAFYGNSL